MFQSVKYIVKEHVNNCRLIIKMAFMDSEKQTIRSSIGIFWTYFHDILYIAVFVMFRLLISGNGNIMGMNGIVYMVTGMIPWFFLSDCLNTGSGAIRANRGIIQSIALPAVILPTISVASIFIKRMFSFLLIFIVCIIFGYIKFFHPLLFIYYVFCMICFGVSINLVLTAIVAISEDFRQLHGSIVRVLIYTMPIIWDFTNVNSHIVQIMLRINPMVYIVKGFRDVFVLGMTQNVFYGLYFWICVIVLFSVGSFLQYKLKKYYADFV